MGKKWWLHWLMVIITFGSIVMGFVCFTINGSVAKTNKEHTELLNAYMMNDAID